MGDFRSTYLRYKNNITVAALSQRIAGLDYDDVVSEMSICLWRAHETWSEEHGVPLNVYWWSLWRNRRADLIRRQQAQKRPQMVLVDDVEELDRITQPYEMSLPPEPPTWCTGVDRLVWDLLAMGEAVKTTISLSGLSRRSYYGLIHRLRAECDREELDT